MENQKEILNKNKLLLDEFIDTASEEDLQEVLSIINYLRRPDPEELESDDEERRERLHTQLRNRFGDFDLNLAENKIKKILEQKKLKTLTKETNEKALDILTWDLADQQIVAILNELIGSGYTRADIMMWIDFNDIPENKRAILPQDRENNQAALQKILSAAAAKGLM